MHAGVGGVFVILDIRDQTPVGGVGGEDIAVAGVFVEGVAVDVVRGFLGG